MQTLPKKLIKYIFTIAIALLPMANSMYAETIRLTSGLVVEGQIVSESDKVIVIQTTRGTFTIKKTEILEMERPGSKDTIAKPPAEENLTVTKMIMMSFIPGYSPAYRSNERPEFGLPFAMLSLNYFARFLAFQTNSRAVGFLNSTEIKNPISLIMNMNVATNPTNYGLSYFDAYDAFGPNYNLVLLSGYIQIRSTIYDKNPDRVVMGEQYTQEEYLNRRRSLFENYVAVSLSNAIVSYFILSRENSLGVLKTSHNGIDTMFYAFPTGDGGTFGTVSRF